MLICDCLQGRTRGLHRGKRWRSIDCCRLVARSNQQHICIRCRRCERLCSRWRSLRRLRAVHYFDVVVCRFRLRFVLTRGRDHRKGIDIGILRRRGIGVPRRDADHSRDVSLLRALSCEVSNGRHAKHRPRHMSARMASTL